MSKHKGKGTKHELHSFWTVGEIKWLKENYLLYAYTRDLAEKLPRHTLCAIHGKLKELGLTGNRLRQNPGQIDRYTIRLWWALHEGPATPEQLIERVGCSRHIQRDACKAFMEAKVIHLSHWVKPKSRGHWRPVYAVGDGLNRRKPVATGKTRTKHVVRLSNRKGNPFGLMIDLAERGDHGNAQHTEDVCA